MLGCHAATGVAITFPLKAFQRRGCFQISPRGAPSKPPSKITNLQPRYITMQSVAKRRQLQAMSSLSTLDETAERNVPHVNEYRQQQTTRRNATSMRSLRRPRQGMDFTEVQRPRGSSEGDDGSAIDFHNKGEVAVATVVEAVARAWRDRRPSSTDGSSHSRPVLPLAACSFLMLSFLSDQTAAFQPSNPHSTPRAAWRDPRKQLRAYAPCYDYSSHGVLLQGSFTGRLGRQTRRLPYVWGQGWSSTPPPHGTLDVTPAGGMGGGDWMAGGPSGGGIRWRGVGGARSSADASTGAREAHATAQAPTYGSFSRAAASSTVNVFPDIVEALSCYKRVHGHVRILPTFKVPSSAPWPENLWNMELGKLIYKLRNEKDVYKRQFPDRMTLLKNVGFEWDHSAVPEEWDLIIRGIEAFFRINRHSRVPTRYVVPAEEPWPVEIWGHKLGSRVAQMRQTGRYLGDDEEIIAERRAILDKLGFEWRLRVHDNDTEDGNPEEFAVLCEGLQVYRDLGGSVPNMPPTFVIPNADPWPLRTRGFPLGNQVRLVRSRRKYAKDSKEAEERLVALGVPISPVSGFEERAQGRWGGPTETRFDKLCKALEMFVHLYGHTQVPVNFEVPRTEPWPVCTWGVKLGTSLTNIVSKGTFIKGHPERQTRLEALGFDTDPGGVRAFKERIASGIAPEDALAESQAAVDFKEEQQQQQQQQPREEAFLLPSSPGDGDAMDSQALLGSVMNSLRTKENSRGSTAGALEDVGSAASSSPLPQPPMTLENNVEIEETTDPVSWSPKQKQPKQEQEQEQPRKLAWEREDPDKETDPSFMKEEFTDEERAAMKDETDLRYWPEDTQHSAARKMIPLLGHLARGSQEVAQVDGPVGTEMVTLPGVVKPDEWDTKTKKTELDLGYAERQVDGYLDYDNDDYVGEDAETGVIDRVKGRRLKKGWSTAVSALDWCTEEDREHILEVDFEWDEFDDGFRWDDVVKGLKLYKDLYDELPDDDFKVPVDYEWPRELSGMNLGSFCRQMRIGDIWAKDDPSRREVLDELGFDWGDDNLYLDFQWPEKLTGHLDLPPHYVVPEEDPWPLPLRGYPAGFCLNIIRAQKELLIKHYPDRYEVLRGMGVMWSDPVLVDWENEEEKIETDWRRWGYVKEDDDDDDISVDPEFGLKDTDPLL